MSSKSRTVLDSPPTLLKLIDSSPLFQPSNNNNSFKSLGPLDEPKTLDQSNITSLMSSLQQTISSQRETIDALTKVNNKMKKENSQLKNLLKKNDIKFAQNNYDQILNSRKRRGSDENKFGVKNDENKNDNNNKNDDNKNDKIIKLLEYNDDMLNLSEYSDNDNVDDIKIDNNIDCNPVKKGWLKMSKNKKNEKKNDNNGVHKNEINGHTEKVLSPRSMRSRGEIELYNEIYVILYNECLLYFDKTIKLQNKKYCNYNHPKGILYLKHYNILIRKQLSLKNKKPIKIYDFTMIPTENAIKTNLINENVKIRFYCTSLKDFLDWTKKIKYCINLFGKIPYPTSKSKYKLYGITEIDLLNKELSIKKTEINELKTLINTLQLTIKNREMEIEKIQEINKNEIIKIKNENNNILLDLRKKYDNLNNLFKISNKSKETFTKEITKMRKENQNMNNEIKKNIKIIENYVLNEKSLFNNIILIQKFNDKIDQNSLQNIGAKLMNKNKHFRKNELYDLVQKGMINLLEETYKIYNNNMNINRLDKEILKNYTNIIRKYIKLQMNYTSLQQNHDQTKEDMKILRKNFINLKNYNNDKNDLILNTGHFM